MATSTDGDNRSGRLAGPIAGTWAALPFRARSFVAAVALAALALVLVNAVATPLNSGDLTTFALILTGGLVSVEATRRLREPAGVNANDMLSAWWLPTAVLLPPLYAVLIPVPLLAYKQLRVRPIPGHRRIFTAAAVALAYAAGSWWFHAVPGTAGGSAALAAGPARWVLAVAACGILANVVNTALIGAVMKITGPGVGWREAFWDRETTLLDLLELCMGVLVAVMLVLDPILILVVLPPVLLLQRGMLHSELRAAARMDAKTGVLNAAAWEREAASELARLQRGNRPSAVLLVDIDHFKQVNDNYGHLAGDSALRAVADALQAQLREQDLLGRFGGEEFSVLLSGADEREARRAAERLRRRIADLVVPVDDHTLIQMTISVGVAVASAADQTLSDLLAAADQGLYAAKAAGRDQVGPLAAPDRRAGSGFQRREVVLPDTAAQTRARGGLAH